MILVFLLFIDDLLFQEYEGPADRQVDETEDNAVAQGQEQ